MNYLEWNIGGKTYVLERTAIGDNFRIAVISFTDSLKFVDFVEFDDGRYITDIFTAARKLLQIYEEAQHEQTAL